MTNQTRRTLCLSVALVALAATAPAFAGPHDFVVQHAGAGGGAEEAAPYLATLLRYAEKTLGWTPDSATGQFFVDAKEAAEYIDSKKPGYGMLDPETYCDLQSKHQLAVIASVQGAKGGVAHLYVVVKDPAYKSLADIKGKKLVSNHLQSPRYLSRVAFEGKVDVATYFDAQLTSSPLRGLKAVDRGEAAATLLDDDQLASAKSLPFGSSLRVIYKSPALVPMPVVAFGANGTADDKKAFAKMLLSMCSPVNLKGNEVCSALQINKFVAPDLAAYEAALKRYSK